MSHIISASTINNLLSALMRYYAMELEAASIMAAIINPLNPSEKVVYAEAKADYADAVNQIKTITNRLNQIGEAVPARPVQAGLHGAARTHALSQVRSQTGITSLMN